ncbi:NAD(P)H-dependent oxidoreductase [Amaricoccus solimangrovi]|uniref:FMN reductase n=1 Tax=Amaricoccus solimangrovi TaxID=2589815 RepID=A0A501WE05_9RHOB|nr:NAD(P)H-dependent oxidoreductase [Amaricoccus solimangrovi]TPE46630.1 FMN reductase [Amaricoccus solimangrovi]
MVAEIVGLSGSISRPSRTRALVEIAVGRPAERYGRRPVVLELGDMASSLGAAARLRDLDAPALAAVERMLGADALVLASPVYKGGYAGLFKHLLDLLDPLALVGKPVLLAATGGGARHALVIEHQLRPLLGFFEAQTLATGIYACDADFRDGGIASERLLDRLDRAVGQFAPFLGDALVRSRDEAEIGVWSA